MSAMVLDCREAGRKLAAARAGFGDEHSTGSEGQMSKLVIAAALLAALATPALAQDVGNPEIGKRIADGQCAECHASALVPGRGPAFAAIARMPSTTATALTVYLRTSHPAMPNIILSPAEQDDVIAYILSLKT